MEHGGGESDLQSSSLLDSRVSELLKGRPLHCVVMIVHGAGG